MSGEQLQHALDSGMDATYGKVFQASEESRGLIDQTRHYTQAICSQLCDTTKHCWHKFPPFRWATYTLTAFNAIPIAILLFWVIVGLGFVSLPVVGVFVFIAFIVAACALLVWGGFQVGLAILSKLGFAK
ncbi:hypothetical protein RclHR1_02100014 [Rhizophagus clarus]|uniref:Uncharacterized protein n=1 Tax=Rhizophagus clarus TaxID=94130 RepID=A0A2Z6QU85_9GLOM|nr:hypothetical protein RclHR1_02100014 [Rhizophagus clarus]GES98403.1 hypothetical protein GLOIN_2v1498193 [Rhizophagus clarus]